MNKQILKNETIFNTRYFEVVNEFPSGYEIWNIGRHNFNFKGYLPLAKVAADYSIDPKTLKAIYIGDEQVCLDLMKKAGRGKLTKKELLQTVKTYLK